MPRGLDLFAASHPHRWEAKPAAFEVDIPASTELAEAEEASERLVHEELGHLYPGCFTCGPDREPGDGLRLFMGQTGANGLLAAAWTLDPGAR